MGRISEKLYFDSSVITDPALPSLPPFQTPQLINPAAKEWVKVAKI